MADTQCHVIACQIESGLVPVGQTSYVLSGSGPSSSVRVSPGEFCQPRLVSPNCVLLRNGRSRPDGVRLVRLRPGSFVRLRLAMLRTVPLSHVG